MSSSQDIENNESTDAREEAGVSNAQASQEAARLGRAYHRKSNVKLIVDSCADFAPEVAEALGVEVVQFTYVMGGKEYPDDLWKTMTPKEFYDRMRAGEYATTSAVTPGHYLEVFERAAQEGTPTVYLAFTRGLSSSVDAARQAADMVRESHPDFEIHVVDNVCPSAAAELLAIEAVHQAASGLTAKELVAWAEEARYYIHGYFTLDSFDALARGGRIPPAAATVGGKLDIKPELSYDTNGALTLRGMCRGRKKALRAIIADFKANYLGAEGGDELQVQGPLQPRADRRRADEAGDEGQKDHSRHQAAQPREGEESVHAVMYRNVESLIKSTGCAGDFTAERSPDSGAGATPTASRYAVASYRHRSTPCRKVGHLAHAGARPRPAFAAQGCSAQRSSGDQ